ncbi:tRNA (adenosine(37)-N6)-threonylcarbamoyltransferase complex dimerization subunit type 1 TsaB [Colibacter massiliensis]|uniref:tRNA (adenosine(37)-N6)-threonylcarbamoyltransferase complex dimerization subunit type 1 TsaB n=1 Tax=Colibacter massiliensis TaxID=1852379 RepID=UPI003F92632E
MFLAIETSSLVSSVALLHEKTLRAEVTVQAKLTHSEQLMPHIADMLQKAAVHKNDIDGIAVSVGPGSFTGLRIGLATAKGLSFARKIPLAGIETPRVLAWNFVDSAKAVCPLIDAQKGNVYVSLYAWHDGVLTEIEPVSVAPATDVIARFVGSKDDVFFCGDGALKFAAAIESAGGPCRLAPPHMVIPRAGALALAAAERFAAGDTDDCMTLTPAYKRRSEAEILWEKRRSGASCP